MEAVTTRGVAATLRRSGRAAVLSPCLQLPCWVSQCPEVKVKEQVELLEVWRGE